MGKPAPASANANASEVPSLSQRLPARHTATPHILDRDFCCMGFRLHVLTLRFVSVRFWSRSWSSSTICAQRVRAMMDHSSRGYALLSFAQCAYVSTKMTTNPQKRVNSVRALIQSVTRLSVKLSTANARCGVGVMPTPALAPYRVRRSCTAARVVCSHADWNIEGRHDPCDTMVGKCCGSKVGKCCGSCCRVFARPLPPR
jgi:hypothetical protein